MFRTPDVLFLQTNNSIFQIHCGYFGAFDKIFKIKASLKEYVVVSTILKCHGRDALRIATAYNIWV